MPTYTITAVDANVREWQSQQGGPMRSYKMTLRNADGRELAGVEWSRKPTSPPPRPGEQVEGDVDTSGQYGPKFKAAQRVPPAGGGGLRPRDPAERRSIAMQSSIRAAVDILKLAAEHGDYRPPSAGDVASQVKQVAASLFHHVMDAEADRLPRPTPPRTARSDVPSDVPWSPVYEVERPANALTADVA